MNAPKRYIALSTLVAAGLLSLSSCSGTNLGDGLAIGVTPTNAFIVESDGSSCLDVLNGTTTGDTTGISESVTGPRLFFTDFKIQWTKSDPLTVAVIRVTVIGSGMTPFSTELSNDEVAAMIGQAGGVISTNSIINSNATANRTGYPPCGLDVGPLTLNADANTTPSIPPSSTAGFTARVLIEVIGSSTAADGTVSPVKQSLYANAQYLD